MGDEPGLRERKKRETRQRIADVASMLFMVRGFDAVTVAEIAEAANVSRVTVFNYFRRKEDMLFDRQPETVELLTRAVRDRRPGESIVAAVHRTVAGLAVERHPITGLRDGIEPFFRTVYASPTLRAAWRENAESLRDELAGVIADEVGAEPGDPLPALVAAMIGATFQTAFQHAVDRIMAGDKAADIEPVYLALLDTGFAMIERGLPGYGVRERLAQREAGEIRGSAGE